MKLNDNFWCVRSSELESRDLKSGHVIENVKISLKLTSKKREGSES